MIVVNARVRWQFLQISVDFVLAPCYNNLTYGGVRERHSANISRHYTISGIIMSTKFFK